jgi:hypothetical protein
LFRVSVSDAAFLAEMPAGVLSKNRGVRPETTFSLLEPNLRRISRKSGRKHVRQSARRETMRERRQFLIEAQVLEGRKLTSHLSIRKDLENAGAEWFDAEVARGPAGRSMRLFACAPTTKPPAVASDEPDERKPPVRPPEKPQDEPPVEDPPRPKKPPVEDPPNPPTPPKKPPKEKPPVGDPKPDKRYRAAPLGRQ